MTVEGNKKKRKKLGSNENERIVYTGTIQLNELSLTIFLFRSRNPVRRTFNDGITDKGPFFVRLYERNFRSDSIGELSARLIPVKRKSMINTR